MPRAEDIPRGAGETAEKTCEPTIPEIDDFDDSTVSWPAVSAPAGVGAFLRQRGCLSWQFECRRYRRGLTIHSHGVPFAGKGDVHPLPCLPEYGAAILGAWGTDDQIYWIKVTQLPDDLRRQN